MLGNCSVSEKSIPSNLGSSGDELVARSHDPLEGAEMCQRTELSPQVLDTLVFEDSEGGTVD